jgi:hypothetical protein
MRKEFESLLSISHEGIDVLSSQYICKTTFTIWFFIHVSDNPSICSFTYPFLCQTISDAEAEAEAEAPEAVDLWWKRKR